MIRCPVAGLATVLARVEKTTASDPSNYHILGLDRSGAPEGLTIDTRDTEVEAGVDVNLGQIRVGAGDVLTLSVTVVGSPSPRLYPGDFVLGCALREGA